ncbi:MAG: type II toxin-antitoxin system VapC family toxin [Gemmatimonadaceae bacterium]|jgi:uncharacterized protein|nr:type II toxin-antitoxin system VapC family toxin [Gemmatimonadaceae bacterium]
MIVPDVNLLVYVLNADSPHHARALAWWERVLTGHEAIGLPWVTVLGVLRIATNRRIMSAPLPIDEAMTNVEDWLRQPVVSVVEPGPEHARILSDMLRQAGRGANLVTDAHLAALCVERGATLCSADGDFQRFRGLRYENPLLH